MSKILVIGAHGRAGAAAVAEARGRGHDVLGVTRGRPGSEERGADRSTGQPARGAADGGAAGGGAVVVGDVLDVERIAELASGRDVVVAGVYDPAPDFFPRAARALVEGLGAAGVRRLVWVGLASILPTADGTLLMDTDGYPREYRSFFLAHQAALDVFAASGLDWVSLAPAGDFSDLSPQGSYRAGPADAGARISYADFAVALVDEADHPTRHRAAYGVLV
ncbi:NAD(P)-dependent oxidoreductase [Kribbella sp. NPDC059898]|uniref:NAD(P)-dependent oxidoreductase n=1 Tax=Kribbella sp. NPDC059898 TaxID=3346995 RepID=UPI0036640543